MNPTFYISKGTPVKVLALNQKWYQEGYKLTLVKKIGIIIFLINWIYNCAEAQTLNFEWANQVSGISLSKSTTCDASGNVYMIGRFHGTADMDPSPAVLNFVSNGGSDVFISKYDQNGNFLWSRQFGAGGNDDGYELKIDPSGNVVATGYFQSTIDFDPGPSVYNITGNGANDIFILKLDPSGNFIWAYGIGGSGIDYGLSMTIDGSGALYFTGQFSSTVDFNAGPGVFNMTSAGGSDIFVLKMDLNGNFIWARRFGGTATDFVSCIETDNNGDVIFTGSFGATADFDPSPAVYNLTAVGLSTDSYIAKLDANGNFTWAIKFGSPFSDAGLNLDIDQWNNIISIGNFYGTADFDPGPGVFNLTPVGTSNAYISKLDAAGNFIWAKGIESTVSSAGDNVNVNANNEIFCSGSFVGTADFDPGAGVNNVTSAGSTDIYFLLLDVNGVYKHLTTIGGSSTEFPNGTYIDASQNIYVSGTFSGTTDFDPGTNSYNLTSVGTQNSFILKLNQNIPLPIELLDFSAEEINEGIELTWTTANESNNNYFTIEKSLKYGEWLSLGVIQGAGNSTTLQQYSLIDLQPVRGTQYYRLKQTDFDGSFSYSKIIAVSFKLNNTHSIQVYPNPISDVLIIEMPSTIIEKTHPVRILDALGRHVASESIKSGYTVLNLCYLSPGVYTVEVLQDNMVLRNTVLKK